MTTEAQQTPSGELEIDDNVLDRIAALAAEAVEGVYSLGRSGIAGALDSVRGGGVSSEHGHREAAFDFDVVVQWGHNIPRVVDEVRTEVADAIETMTNLKTVEINIHVRDVHRDDPPAGRKLD